jgi:hypothetical protein
VDAFPRLPELDPTLLEQKIEVPNDPVEGLEPSAAPLGDVPVEAVPDLEQTLQGPVADTPVETLIDLEPTLTEEVPVQPVAPKPPTCRYCGMVGQVQGLFCDRCGMRLSRSESAPEEDPVEAIYAGRRCLACGGRRFDRGLCVECGTLLPAV